MKVLTLFFLVLASLQIQAGEIKPSRVKQEKDSSIFRLNGGMYFGGGFTNFLGDFTQYHDFTKPFVFGIHFSSFRVNLNMNACTGNATLKKPINTTSYSIPIDTLNYFAFLELGLGYEILRTRNWQINPQFGFSTFQMGWTNQEIDENDSPIKINISLANDINYRFWTHKFKNGGAIGFDFRYRLSWAPFRFEDQLNGKFLNNQFSIGVFGY